MVEKKASKHDKEEKKEEFVEPEPKTLHRSSKNKIIAGVAGGIAEYFNVDPAIIRIIFIILTLFSGSGLIIYIVLWIILPHESRKIEAFSEQNIRENVQDIRARTQKFASDMGISRESDTRFWLGIFIVIIGVLFLLSNFGFFYLFNVGRLWPLILIALGLVVLFKDDKR